MKFWVFLAAAICLAGCGSTTSQRGLSGAGIGAGIGLIAGPPGVAAGAAIGAGVGALTEKDDIYLGEPLWKE